MLSGIKPCQFEGLRSRQLLLGTRLIYCVKMMAAVLVLSNLSIVACSQNIVAFPTFREREVLAAIGRLSEYEEGAIDSLMSANRDIVSRRLWEVVLSGAALVYRQNRERSLRYYVAASRIAERLADDTLLSVSYYELGRAYSGLYKADKAIIAYGESRKAYMRMGDVGSDLALVGEIALASLRLYDYKQAAQCVTYLLTAREKGVGGGERGRYAEGLAYFVLGYLWSRDGAYDRSIESYHKSLACFYLLGGKAGSYSASVAEVLSGIGRVHLQLEDWAQALAYLMKSQDMLKEGVFQDKIAGGYNDLGVLFLLQGDYLSALEYFQKALVLYGRLGVLPEMARVNYNIGLIHQRQARYEEAIVSFNLAKEQGLASKATDIVIVAGEGISTIYRERGEYALALESLANSEELAFSIQDRYLLAEIQMLKAKVYLSAGMPETAILEAERSVAAAGSLGAKETLYLAKITLGGSHLLLKQYQLAAQDFLSAANELERSRLRVVGPEYEKQLFFENKIESYHGLIKLMTAQGIYTDAFIYAELTKARTLVDVLTQKRLRFFNVLTLKEQQDEKRLNQQIIDLNRALRSESLKLQPSAEQVSQLTTQLGAARSAYAAFETRMYSIHAELQNGAAGPREFQLADLRDVIPTSGTVVLEYVVMEEGVYIFVIGSRPQAQPISVKSYYVQIKRKELVDLVARFHRSIAERELRFSSQARQLYDLLLRPVEQDLKGKTSLCLIPDDALWNVPFQALQRTENHYLLEDFSVSYAPSLYALKMFQGADKGKGGRKEQTFLSFANPSLGEKTAAQSPSLSLTQRTGHFEPLPEAEVEANRIKQLFPNARSRVFVGEAATESAFKAMASEYSVLHLATHGMLDDRHPLYSYVLFSDKDGAENDGLLEAREVMNLDLKADLVVLSACETARGGIRRGEGVVGLLWAFLAAGAKTTVVSQWRVNSRSTAQLMVGFYQRMRGPAAKPAVPTAEALRQAALSVMRDSRYRHPFYWAGFILVGRGM